MSEAEQLAAALLVRLEKKLETLFENARQFGREEIMIERGELPATIKRKEAVNRLGSEAVYMTAIRTGQLQEMKDDPTKPNSPIRVDRLQLIKAYALHQRQILHE